MNSQTTPVKFLSDVTGTITTGNSTQEIALTKYVVLTGEGDLFISGITHAEIIKVAAQLMKAGMEQALLYEYTANRVVENYSEDDVRDEIAGMMTAAISHTGQI